MVQEAVCERQIRPPLTKLPQPGPETPGLEGLKELMQHCWSHEPKNRPSFKGELGARVGLDLSAGGFSLGNSGSSAALFPECRSNTEEALNLVNKEMDAAVSTVSVQCHPQPQSGARVAQHGSLGHPVSPH